MLATRLPVWRDMAQLPQAQVCNPVVTRHTTSIVDLTLSGYLMFSGHRHQNDGSCSSLDKFLFL